MTTDCAPQYAAMGSLLVDGTHGRVAFLFAFVVTNGSQSMTSADDTIENHERIVTLLAWATTVEVVGASVVFGYWFVPPRPDYWLAEGRPFAGAILASLAGGIFPYAYEDAGPYVTLATAVGFGIYDTASTVTSP